MSTNTPPPSQSSVRVVPRPAVDLNPSSARDAELSPQQRLQLSWQLFNAVEYQVQVADRKVQAVFGANTLMVAALTLNGQTTLADLQSQGLNIWELLSIFVRLLLLASVFCSAVCGIFALAPRVRKPSLPRASGGAPLPVLPIAPRSLFFFRDISASPVDEFVQDFSQLSAEEAASQLLCQVHQVSAVVSEKYRWSGRAAAALTCSLMLWILVLVLRFFS